MADFTQQIDQGLLLAGQRRRASNVPGLGKLKSEWRYAMLVTVVLEITATLINELLDLHGRILAKPLSSAQTSINSSSRRSQVTRPAATYS